MSPSVKTTYSRQEVREVREAFRDWTWGTQALEPDGRVSVLYSAHPGQETRGFLARCQHGWLWGIDAEELQEKAKRVTPYSWNAAIRDLGGDGMRVPTEQELQMGGFRVTVDSELEENEPSDDEEGADEARKHLDKGLELLQFSDMKTLGRAEVNLMASIAISLHELVGLHKKYDIDNLRVEVDPGPTGQAIEQIQEQLDKMADEPEPRTGPVPDEDFPYAR